MITQHLKECARAFVGKIALLLPLLLLLWLAWQSAVSGQRAKLVRSWPPERVCVKEYETVVVPTSDFVSKGKDFKLCRRQRGECDVIDVWVPGRDSQVWLVWLVLYFIYCRRKAENNETT